MTPSDKLHLGAYHIVYEGWLNTDVTGQLWIARVPGLAGLLFKLGRMSPENYRRHREGLFKQIRYLNVGKRFPFPDNTFRYVFSSHMLEHLYPDEAEFCLREIHRVLRPGGLVRTVLPDLDQIVASYDPRNPAATLESVFQGDSRRTHERARHWWHYNETSLRALLERIGFSQIERCAYRQGRCADVEIIDSRPLSLFMEAVK
ncbi:MAG TPA: methyltransferase domain-containing protein [Herpetosiphonaceae bacterium]|nr:methyltransferase domain-containing protein [Herpetosiphonaceae bacterium]